MRFNWFSRGSGKAGEVGEMDGFSRDGEIGGDRGLGFSNPGGSVSGELAVASSHPGGIESGELVMELKLLSPVLPFKKS